MAETTDKFCLVKGVCGHLHATHGLHLLVHLEELVAGDLDLKVGLLALICTERVLVKLDSKRLRGVGGRVLELGRVSGGLDASETELGLESGQRVERQERVLGTYETTRKTGPCKGSHFTVGVVVEERGGTSEVSPKQNSAPLPYLP